MRPAPPGASADRLCPLELPLGRYGDYLLVRIPRGAVYSPGERAGLAFDDLAGVRRVVPSGSEPGVVGRRGTTRPAGFVKGGLARMEFRTVQRHATLQRVMFGFSMGLYLFTYTITFDKAFSEAPGGGGTPGDRGAFAKLLLGGLFTFGYVLAAFLDLAFGAIADVRGHRYVLVRSFVYRALFFAGLAVIGYTTPYQLLPLPAVAGVGYLTIALFAAAYAYWSGAYTAWYYELVRAVGQEEQHETLVARLGMRENAAFMLGGGVSAYLLYLDLSYVGYVIGGLVSAVAALHAVWGCPYPPRQLDLARSAVGPGPVMLFQQVAAVVAVAARYCFRVPGIFYALQLNAGFTLLLFVTDCLWPLYIQDAVADPIKDRQLGLLVWVVMLLIVTFGSLIGNVLMARLSHPGGAIVISRAVITLMAITLPLAAGFYIVNDEKLSQLDSFTVVIILTVLGSAGLLYANFAYVSKSGLPLSEDVAEADRSTPTQLASQVADQQQPVNRMWKHLLWTATSFALAIMLLSVIAWTRPVPLVLFMFLMALAQVAVGAKLAPYDALMNRLITTAEGGKTAQTSDELRSELLEPRVTVQSAATVFNALFVLIFFVPVTFFGVQNTLKGWSIAAGLLLVIVAVTWKKVR